MSFKNLFIRIALPTLLFSACAVNQVEEQRGLGDLKADFFLGSCEPNDCGTNAANGSGWCDDSCGSFGDCASGAFAVCGVAECQLTVDGCGSVCVDGQCFDSQTPVGQRNIECLVTDQGSTVGCENSFCIQDADPSKNTCADPGPILPTPVECLVEDGVVIFACPDGKECFEGGSPGENLCLTPLTPLPTPVECLITDDGEPFGCTEGQTCAEVVIDCDTAEICEDCPPLCLKDKCIDL